jgi:acetyltransferase AlgX (SGNH hydrolase-like protein)
VLRFHSDWIDDPPLGSQLLAMAARGLLNRDLRRQAATWVAYMRPGSTTDAGLWTMTDDLVGETLKFPRGAGVAYVPFLIPSSVEVGGTAWSHLGWLGKEPPTGIDVALPARRLTAMFEKRGIHVIDLTESLKSHGGPALYYPLDGHWTDASHRAASDALTMAVARSLGR